MSDRDGELDRRLARAERLEPLAVRSWPARETAGVDGWLLRFTDGFSHRGNSVVTMGFTGGDLTAAIASVERQYRDRGLAPMFHLTPATRPSNLEAVLAMRGYRSTASTHVWTADATDVVGRLPASSAAAASAVDDPGFRALVIDGSHSEADGRERLDILARVPAPNLFALVTEEGRPAACGVGIRLDDHVVIFAMRANSAHRRRGYAARVLAAIAGWAVAQGAKNLFLQVEDDNLPARALYAKAGFAPAYPYRFYVAPNDEPGVTP